MASQMLNSFVRNTRLANLEARQSRKSRCQPQLIVSDTRAKQRELAEMTKGQCNLQCCFHILRTVYLAQVNAINDGELLATPS